MSVADTETTPYQKIVEDMSAEVGPSSAEMGLTNAEIVNFICTVLQQETIPLTGYIDFSAFYADPPCSDRMVAAFAYLAYLRWLMYARAVDLQPGMEDHNERNAAESELWFRKLRDRGRALRKKTNTQHRWLH